MSHSLDSFDLVPSDSYLFPTLIQKLESIQMVDDNEPFDRLQDLSVGINQPINQ
jgi:hypothetical protein